MYSIFFDLETSDREPIGQIINFAFLVVDKDWKVVDELCGDVKLSCLQLPSPGAIMANRVNVLDLQEQGKYTEREGCEAIADFFERVLREYQGTIPWIGFNSFRFDLNYLRTSLIRNGINPYFGGKRIVHRDLLAAVRKLSACDPTFPAPMKGGDPEPEAEKSPRLSLKLESVSQELKLLEGKQLHSSRDDVILTINLARKLSEQFGLDVRTYDSYEALPCHTPANKGKLFITVEPEYDLSKESRTARNPVTLLDFDRRYSLWVDLKKFTEGKGRGSVSFYKNQGSGFILGAVTPADLEWEAVAHKAFQELKEVNLSNFFTTSSCDIEQDIYRVDFDGIEALRRALWEGKREAVKELQNKDVTTLYVRAMIANHSWGTSRDSAVREKLSDYGRYRYGGKLVLSKSVEVVNGKGPRLHKTLDEILVELEQELNSRTEPTDHELLLALKQYILKSDLYKLLKEDGAENRENHP